MLGKIKKNPYLYILFKSNIHLIELFRNIKGYGLIKKFRLFNFAYYNKKYPNVKKSKMNPIIHYLYYGYREGKNPSTEFETSYYLKKYPQVKKRGMNPLIHYIFWGKAEGKSIKSIKPQMIKMRDIINKNYLFLQYLNLTNHPMVSIIIPNLNGVHHLKRLFKDFKKNLVYDNYEIIVIDNGSTDKSIIFLEDQSQDLPIKIVKNENNKNFSQSNNQGAKIAKGEYLLLLNNDIETTYNWLNEMMGDMLNNENVGSVGAKLVFPYNKTQQSRAFKVQHIGIFFKVKGKKISAHNYGHGKDPFDDSIKTEEVPGVTAAALLIKKSVYEEVGGLDEKYIYGYEDVDLALNLYKKGYKNILSSSALLFHNESATRNKKIDKKFKLKVKNNISLLNEKWGDYVFKQVFKDKLNNKMFFTKEKLKIGFIIYEINLSLKSTLIILGISKELKKLGYEITFRFPSDNVKTADFDVLINSCQDFDISKLKLKQNLIKIDLNVNHLEKEHNNNDFNYKKVALELKKIIKKNLIRNQSMD